MINKIDIQLLEPEGIEDFLVYLNDHISDNGKGSSPLFLPISRNNLHIPKEVAGSFRQGLSISIDELGWRRVLIAVNKKSEIIGHVDLKSHNQNYTHHRVVMGMGVHRDYRNIGMGNLLVKSIVDWANRETGIEHIDLWVLAENSPAIRLYEKLGFQRIGEVEDMFRIDGASLNYIMMVKKIK